MLEEESLLLFQHHHVQVGISWLSGPASTSLKKSDNYGRVYKRFHSGNNKWQQASQFSHRARAFWFCLCGGQSLSVGAQSPFCGARSLLSDASSAPPTVPTPSACNRTQTGSRGTPETGLSFHAPLLTWSTAPLLLLPAFRTRLLLTSRSLLHLHLFLHPFPTAQAGMTKL